MKMRVRLRYLIGFLITVSLLSVASIVFRDFYMFGDHSSGEPDLSGILSADAEHPFKTVSAEKKVILPRDFNFHPEYQHEWWNFFANVQDKNGNKYSIHWNYSRLANSGMGPDLGWKNSQIYLSHIAISNSKRVWREQRVARGGIGQAGINSRPFRMWVDDWAWRSLGQTPFPGHLDIKTDRFSLSLYSDEQGPYVLPGRNGYQTKHSSLPLATYNFQAPFISVYGQIKLSKNSDPISVEGTAFMDKEWGTGLMDRSQRGWDKFILQLDEKTTLTLNRYRHDRELPYMFGNLSTADGDSHNLLSDEIIIVPLNKVMLKNGRVLPMDWRITVAKYDVDVKVSAVNQRLWLPFVLPYWEGAITTSGSHSAQGFMQLTGY